MAWITDSIKFEILSGNFPLKYAPKLPKINPRSSAIINDIMINSKVSNKY
jgi:hypothetical protein